jgi:hypothetical protein
MTDTSTEAVQSPYFTYASGAQIIDMGIEEC